MKKIYAISGSASINSSNRKLLVTLLSGLKDVSFDIDQQLVKLPHYTPEGDRGPTHQEVVEFRNQIKQADIVMISTPEYLHNIPAILKNGMEWLKTNGELYDKNVLAMTYTPHPPRGQYAMSSLLNSLRALHARILLEIPLYQSEILQDNGSLKIPHDIVETLRIAMDY